MQIDFHHAVTYVVARLAGFDHPNANIVAHAAQYVDDSSTSGFIRFDNGMRYKRMATAHPMADLDNLDNDENTVSWLPFHFLPGNDFQPPAQHVDHYPRKLICRPDSHIAKDMMEAAIKSKDEPYSLHRLGIAAHVFADTFAHQGFAGLNHHINKAQNIRDANGDPLAPFPVPPVGHGQVGTYPDQPFLVWSYDDWTGTRIYRDNPTTFTLAAHRLCEEFQRFLKVPVTGLATTDGKKLTDMFKHIQHDDGKVRHKEWIEAIANDHFGLRGGGVQLTYEGKYEGSWKHDALGDAYIGWRKQCEESAKQRHEIHGESWLKKFTALSGKKMQSLVDKINAAADSLGSDIPIKCSSPENFLRSDYKKFHDAARAQRHELFEGILPKYGICAG